MIYIIRDSKMVALAGVANILPTDIPVYNMADCAVRVQNPTDTKRGAVTGHPERSKILPQTFHHTVPQVDQTVRDFNNDEGKNVALWLNGDYALRYAGIDRRLEKVEQMTPQPGLDSDDCVVTVILPSVFRGAVVRVRPSAELQDEMKRGGTTVDAYGLNGTVRAGEIFEIAVTKVKAAIGKKENEGFYSLEYPENAHPRAVKAVIDLLSRYDPSKDVKPTTRF